MAKNFMVNRDNVWIGLLYSSEAKKENYNKYYMGDQLQRYIVFTKDNYGLCHDVFNSVEDGKELIFPEYGVEYSVDVDRSIIVFNAVNLSSILEALKCRQFINRATLGKTITTLMKPSFYRRHAKKLINDNNLTKEE